MMRSSWAGQSALKGMMSRRPRSITDPVRGVGKARATPVEGWPIELYSSSNVGNMKSWDLQPAIVGDIDNDGLPDVFFTGNQVRPKLYRNLGDLKFEDFTSSSKLDKMPKGWYTGSSMVDLNGDGWLAEIEIIGGLGNALMLRYFEKDLKLV